MNYRHIYHAGNFADVLKHVVLSRVIEHLKLKPAPFRVIDTHAGLGLYDLGSEQAQKTGEWRNGIGRLLAAEDVPGEAAELLAPYLAVIRSVNEGESLTCYPGSPLIARRLMRRGDQLVANELHPQDGGVLHELMRNEPDTKVLRLDAWTALKSLLPPKERRGMVLIDAPFEQAGELERLAQGLAAATRRFATGTYLLWYPIKDAALARRFRRAIHDLGLPKLMSVELLVRGPARADQLNGSGLAILNPPFRLKAELAALLPFLAKLLAQDHAAGSTVQMLRD